MFYHTVVLESGHGQRGATVIGLGNGAAIFAELLGGDPTDICHANGRSP